MNHINTLIAAIDINSDAYQLGYRIGQIVGGLLLLFVLVMFVVSLVQFIRTRKRGWLIGLIVTVVPIFLCFLAAVSIGFYQGFKSAKAGLNTYSSDEEVGPDRILSVTGTPLQMKIPEHWSPLSGLHDDASLQAGNLLREEYLIVLVDNRLDFAGDFSEFADLTQSMITQSLLLGSRSDEKELSLGGIPAKQCTIEGQIEGLNICYLHTSLEGVDHFYQVISWTLKSRKPTAFSTFQDVLGTISE